MISQPLGSSETAIIERATKDGWGINTRVSNKGFSHDASKLS
jgi:hypothetical protein